MKKLSQKINTPICVGENFYSEWQFEDVCELNAAEILQADVIRCGGITPFLKIISITDRYNKKLMSHLMPELSVHLIGLCKSGYFCEFLELFSDKIFNHAMNIDKGIMEIPSVLGVDVISNKYI